MFNSLVLKWKRNFEVTFGIFSVLETCENLNVSSFPLLFRRFCSRCGLSVLLLSDNASTFKSACQEIRKIARWNKGIIWTFIIARSSWVGGTWERKVRSEKRCLKKTLGRSLLIFEEITTIVCKIEAVLCDKPITYCYNDEGGILYPPPPQALVTYKWKLSHQTERKSIRNCKHEWSPYEESSLPSNLLSGLQFDGGLNICKVYKKFQADLEVKARTLRSEM